MRFPSCLLALASLALALNAAAQSASNTANKTFTEVPLLDCDGTPCVDATIGAGHNVRLGIDTGNAESVIDSKVAAAAGLQPVGTVPKNAPGGMFRTAMPEVHLGNLALNVSRVLGMDLGEMVQQRQMPHVDGTLAYTAFTGRVLELDFAAHKLRVYAPAATAEACTNACSKISLITFGKQGPPIVVAEGFAINGKKVTAQVDSMYTGSLLVYTASIEKLELASEAATQQSEMFPLTDGGVAMRVATAKAETFDGIDLGGGAPRVYFPTPDVHEPDGLFDATVGLALFRSVVVTFDFHNMTIQLRRSPSAHA